MLQSVVSASFAFLSMCGSISLGSIQRGGILGVRIQTFGKCRWHPFCLHLFPQLVPPWNSLFWFDWSSWLLREGDAVEAGDWVGSVAAAAGIFPSVREPRKFRTVAKAEDLRKSRQHRCNLGLLKWKLTSSKALPNDISWDNWLTCIQEKNEVWFLPYTIHHMKVQINQKI